MENINLFSSFHPKHGGNTTSTWGGGFTENESEIKERVYGRVRKGQNMNGIQEDGDGRCIKKL